MRHLGWEPLQVFQKRDRSRTIQTAIAPETRPRDLSRPGHVFPLRAQAGGLLKRAGHTEAAVDLARLAGLYAAGVLCEIQNSNGSMAHLPELRVYAQRHNLKIVNIADLIRYRLRFDRFVEREAIADLPSKFGHFQVYGYRNTLDNSEAIAIVKGNSEQFLHQSPLVQIHAECLTGDAFGSLRCDCRQQLQTALQLIEAEGQGVVVYLRQEGQGIGLINKLKAYSLQDQGLDTVAANERFGFEPDLRTYGMGAQILKDLELQKIRLLTNNLCNVVGLSGWGLDIVERVPLMVPANDYSASYLTKAEKLGHLLQSF